MKKQLLLSIGLLMGLQIAEARSISPSDRPTSEPTLAVCSLTRVSLTSAKTMTAKMQAPLYFYSDKPGTGKATVEMGFDLMPSYKIHFEISFVGKVDSTRMMTIEKETGKIVSQYSSSSILMNFVSGAGVAYTIQPNNSFMTPDGKFIFDLACGEAI